MLDDVCRICAARETTQLASTLQLADALGPPIFKRGKGKKGGKTTHPATRVFQVIDWDEIYMGALTLAYRSCGWVVVVVWGGGGGRGKMSGVLVEGLPHGGMCRMEEGDGGGGGGLLQCNCVADVDIQSACNMP